MSWWYYRGHLALAQHYCRIAQYQSQLIQSSTPCDNAIVFFLQVGHHHCWEFKAGLFSISQNWSGFLRKSHVLSSILFCCYLVWTKFGKVTFLEHNSRSVSASRGSGHAGWWIQGTVVPKVSFPRFLLTAMPALGGVVKKQNETHLFMFMSVDRLIEQCWG